MPGCGECEALFVTGAAARPHSNACWDWVAGLLGYIEDGGATIARSRGIMEQYQSILANIVVPESFHDVPTPLAAARWPTADEVADHGVSDADETPASNAANVEASMSAIYAQYNQCKADCKATKDGIRQVFERLNHEQVAKAERRRIRARRTKVKNDVGEVCPALRVTEVAEATGLRPGWVVGLTVSKEDGTPWSPFIKEN